MEDILKRTMVQLQINTFVNDKFTQALNNVYTVDANVEDIIEILLEAAEKIKKLE